MKAISILIYSLIFCINTSFAQQVVQPKIMVIPYTKEGEDIRTVLEADENKRIILTKIKDPNRVRNIINDLIEEDRANRKVHQSEIQH